MKGTLYVHNLKKAASQTWLQFAFVGVLAVAAGLLINSVFHPLGSEASASDFAADPSQARALADGVVTQGEYTSAVNRTLACVRAAGGEVKSLRYEDYRNVPAWNFVVSGGGDAPGGMSVYDGCWWKFSRDVEFAWAKQEQAKVTPAKRAADEKAALACAAQEGLGVNSIAELRDLNNSGQRPNGGDPSRCVTIAFDGYDLNEHPPLTVD
jgi:hypothetical protein